MSSTTPESRLIPCPVCGSNIKIGPADPTGDAPCSQCGYLLWFTWEDLGDVQVIKPTGSLLDTGSLDSLMDTIALRHGMRIAIDLSKVQHLSSAVLGRLVKLKKKVGGVGGRIVLRHIHPELRDIFRVHGYTQPFDIED
jgi:anti-anti-sigma factor